MSDAPRKAGRPTKPIPRQKLLGLARDCFAEFGFAGTSMNTIAQRADIRKASLFHHFATKEKLYIEVISIAVAELGVFVQAAAFSEGSFSNRLDRLSDSTQEYLGKHPATARLLLWEVIGNGAFMNNPAGRAVPFTIEETARFLTEGMEAGAIPSQDPKHLAMSVIAIHLLYFAVSELGESIFNSPVFSPLQLDNRQSAVREQTRRICGVDV